MRVDMKAAWILLAALAVASPAAARDVTLHVDGKAMPWTIGVNPKLNYGRHDGKAPAILWNLHLLSGTKIRFKASGSTTTAAGGSQFGPEGQADYLTNASPGNSGTFFPSKYMDAKSYPAHLNELVGAFIDADGKLVGKPFPVRREAEVEVPEGALAVALGINDDIFSDNSGGLDVIVQAREGEVIVQ